MNGWICTETTLHNEAAAEWFQAALLHMRALLGAWACRTDCGAWHICTRPMQQGAMQEHQQYMQAFIVRLTGHVLSPVCKEHAAGRCLREPTKQQEMSQ